jgi:serine/threonine protein kinase
MVPYTVLRGSNGVFYVIDSKYRMDGIFKKRGYDGKVKQCIVVNEKEINQNSASSVMPKELVVKIFNSPSYKMQEHIEIEAKYYQRVYKFSEVIKGSFKTYLIMPFVNYPTLSEIDFSSLDYDEFKVILIAILDAINQLYHLKVIHNDLTANNLLYDKENHSIKIIDFGKSIDLETEKDRYSGHEKDVFKSQTLPFLIKNYLRTHVTEFDLKSDDAKKDTIKEMARSLSKLCNQYLTAPIKDSQEKMDQWIKELDSGLSLLTSSIQIDAINLSEKQQNFQL